MKIMNRWVKLLLIIIALLLLALVAFVATFDANNYKSEIIEQVEKATGRDFTIDGDINLSIFPWVGLQVNDVALGNDKAFKADQFAAIKRLDIRVNVLPLIKQEVEVNTILLHGLDVSLEVAEDKSNNWSSLSAAEPADAGAQQDANEAPASDTAIADGESSSPLQALKVEGFEFVDATIRYDDSSSDTKATVSELNLKTGAIEFSKPVDVEFGARIESNQPVIDTRLKLTTQLNFNQQFTEISLLDLMVTVLISANDMFQQDESFEIKSTVNVLMDEQRVTLKQTQITALGVTTVADIAVSQFLETPLIKGIIEVQPFNAREVAKRVSVELPEMAKTDALHQVSVRTAITLQGEKFEANDFSLALDDSTLSGWLHVLDLSKQQLRYDLVLNQIDLNDYLPPVAAETAADDANAGVTQDGTVEASGVSGDEKIELPVEMMRELDIKGDLRIASLTAKEYNMQQLVMSLNAQQGKVSVQPLSMNVLDGVISSAVVVDVRQTTPDYRIKLDVDKIRMGPVANPFLKGVMGEKELTMKGAADVQVDIKTTGDTVNQLKKNSLGEIILDMKKTEVNGFDPEFYMRSSVADYVHSKGLGLSKTIMGDYEPREVTVFDLIHSTVKLAKGKARTDDFIMDSKRVKIGAKGYADIIQDSLDMTTSIKLARSKTALEKVLDSPLYVRVHGPFAALQYDMDTDRLKKTATEAFKVEAKAEAEQKVKKELKKETDRLEKKVMDKFKGFF